MIVETAGAGVAAVAVAGVVGEVAGTANAMATMIGVAIAATTSGHLHPVFPETNPSHWLPLRQICVLEDNTCCCTTSMFLL